MLFRQALSGPDTLSPPPPPSIQPKYEAIFKNDSCLFRIDKLAIERPNAPNQGVLRVEKIKLDTMGTSDRPFVHRREQECSRK